MSQLLETQPKYARIADYYRRQIEAGELKPGDRLPSFVEVRAQLGIGQSTLERAHELLEKQALIVREPGRGIFVAEPQRREMKGIIGLSGIHAAKGHHPYFARLLEGVHQTAHRAGVEILLMHEDVPVHPDKVDGVLLYASQPDHVLRQLPPSMPCVSILNQARGVASLTVDDAAGIAAAVEHLVALGHRKIAYLTTWAEHPVARRRTEAYRAALCAAGITPERNWVRPLPNPEPVPENVEVYRAFMDWGHEEMEQWLADGWRESECTALLAHNDDVAIGAMRALTAHGLRVPGDVSVVGFDNTLTAELSHPALTTVNVPLQEIGARSLELLLAEGADSNFGAQAAVETVFRPRLKVRGSTGVCAAVHDNNVSPTAVPSHR